MSKQPTEVTDRQRQIAANVWRHGDATMCTVLVWLGLRYPPEKCENFILLKWEDLGPPLQDDIARELAKLFTLAR